MYENQENQEPRAFTYEELEAKCVELEGRVTRERERGDNFRNQLNNLQSKVDSVEEYLTEAWTDEINGEGHDVLTEICNQLGIDVEVEKTFTVAVDFTVTIKAHRTYDFDSIDDSDFCVDISKSSIFNDWELADTDYSIQSVTQD